MKNLTGHKTDAPSDLNSLLSVQAVDEQGPGGAHHCYEITWRDWELNRTERLGVLRFQNGPVKEFGVNGISMEAVLAILIDRVSDFQAGPYNCEDNEQTLTHLKAALESCNKRTRDRVKRGVEGVLKS